MFGVPVEDPMNVYCDKKSVVTNASVPTRDPDWMFSPQSGLADWTESPVRTGLDHDKASPFSPASVHSTM
jgi:hypothetical protein